ncbi:MAG: VCBS repeat-containing protein [Planctomycetota bacterium]
MSRTLRLARGSAIALGLLFAALPAQQFGLDAVRAQLPALPIDGRDVEFADVDGDGDLDVLLADESGTTQLLWNRGHGRFAVAAPGVVPAGPGASHLALCDIDGDGDPDLHECGYPAERLLRNDGGVFTDVTATQWPSLPYHSYTIAFGDIDGDGDPDAWVGTWSFSRLLENRGGVFVDVSVGRVPSTLGVTLAVSLIDVDGDGDLDALLNADRTRLCLNDGHGVFTDVTDSQLPFFDGAATRYLGDDFDADGDTDILIPVTGGELSPKQDHLFLNDGTGRFTDVTSTHMPVEWRACGGAALADVDGDGDRDVVVANIYDMSPEPIASVSYRNDGAAHFTIAADSGFPTEMHALFDVALGDLDGDGDIDAVFACWDPCPGDPFGFTKLFLNDGAGHFVDATQPRIPQQYGFEGAIAAGDIDGDGIADLLVARAGPYSVLLLGNGRGEYRAAPDDAIEWVGRSGNPVPILFDADGDGDLDAYLGGAQQDALLLNDGTLHLRDATAHLPVEQDTALAAAQGDLDGDGAPDLAIGTDRGLRIWRNRAGGIAGYFEPMPGIPVITDPVRAMLAVDVDHDGDLDLVLGGDLRDWLLRNQGAGVLVDDLAALPVQGPRYTRSLATGDVDGDGDPDLALGDYGDDRLWINDGTGRFRDESASRMPPDLAEARALVLADFDEDGDLDLLVSNGAEYASEPMQLRLNDGRGFFIDASTNRIETTRARGSGALALDIDADGDLDLVLFEFLCCQPIFCAQGQPRILVNRHRQLAAPFLPSRGGALELQLFAQPGYAQGMQLALPALSPAAGAMAVVLPGLGTFALDPNGTIALPWLAVTGAPSTLLVPVPVDSALSGASLACQALFVDLVGSAPPHLSNAVRTRILD